MEEHQSPEQAPKQSKTILIVIVVIVAIAVAGVTVMIFANPSKAPTTTQDTQTNTGRETDSSDVSTALAPATIVFTDDGFTPMILTVKKGTVVTVKNNSSRSVQFSSDNHPSHTEDPEMNLGVLAPGENGTFTANTIGTHGFHDHIDDNITGTLVVTE